MASIERLEKLLARAARHLDDAAGEIRDIRLSSGKNIRKIGELLASISEIRQQIYKRRPDLIPEYLRKKKTK